MDYSKLFSLTDVDQTLKRKKIMDTSPTSGYWGDPNKPDPSITGTMPENPLRNRVSEVLTGNAKTPQVNEGTDGTGNSLGIPQKNLRLAFGLSALSNAVNPGGSGKELMRLSGGLLEKSYRSGERAREIMRQDQIAAERRREEIADKEQERKLRYEDRAEERKYRLEDREADRKFRRELQEDTQRENAPLLNARINRLKQVGTTAQKGTGLNKTSEKIAVKNATAELKSLGAYVDTDEGSIEFPTEMESSINKALKRHGISFYPSKSQDTPGRKTYYLGSYNSGQVNSSAGAFNLEDYLPK